MSIITAVLTVSDRSFRGEREDLSGPLLRDLATSLGCEVRSYNIVPDEEAQIRATLLDLADRQGMDLILTTGGTGPAPRDVTPEATRAVIEREMPGLAELMRMEGVRRFTPFAALSRAVTGIRGKTLIVNLPGNPQAVRESMEILGPLLPAAVALLKGEAPPNGINDPGWAALFGKGGR
ncbi:MAG: molybdopterin adenylyltransferase [Anaerolineae bacterium]|jgi:molybdenum cofactor synthesis domain-containing protein|nr:molybdopterin adenylyltransferase [Anaerolineae bacterium]MDH7474955.1 molybdopterin adenylyltransferase [Anaerolineae bacterium]